MKYIAIIFAGYEVFKLLTLKSTLSFFLYLRHDKLLMSETYHLFMNLGYLVFAIVLLFHDPLVAGALFLLSLLMWLAEKLKSDIAYSVALVADGAACLAVLVLFILKG